MALPSTANQASMSSFPYVEGQEQPDEEQKNSRFLARLNKGISKISGPMNRAAMKAGCEPFSPQNLDFEFDKVSPIDLIDSGLVPTCVLLGRSNSPKLLY